MSEVENVVDNSMQIFLAKLVTNTKYVKLAMQNVNKFAQSFDFDETMQKSVISFFMKYGRQFLASSILLQKKRKDNILNAMQVTKYIFPEKVLDGCFNKYFSSIKFDEHVSKNPVDESIIFCEFILKNQALLPYQKQVLSYEIERNRIIVEAGKLKPLHFSVVDTFSQMNMEYLNIRLHPVRRVKDFYINISTIIQRIKNTKKINISDIDHKREKVLFYKSWHKEGVTAIKVTEELLAFLQLHEGSNSLFDIYQDVSTLFKMDFFHYQALLMGLVTSGLVIIVEKDKRYVH